MSYTRPAPRRPKAAPADAPCLPGAALGWLGARLARLCRRRAGAAARIARLQDLLKAQAARTRVLQAELARAQRACAQLRDDNAQIALQGVRAMEDRDRWRAKAMARSAWWPRNWRRYVDSGT